MIYFRQLLLLLELHLFLPLQVFFEHMSNDPIGRFTTLIIGLVAFSQCSGILFVPFHDVEADVGSFGKWVYVFFVLDGVYFFVPFKSFELRPCVLITIGFFLGRRVPIAEAAKRSLFIVLFGRDFGLRLHILFVK